MWILIKLAAALVGFIVRFQGIRLGKPAGTIEGSPYFFSSSRTRRGSPISYRLQIPMEQGLAFSFHYESAFDALFKKLGLANEVQTGDSQFDSKIYVTCDHTGVRELLRSHEGIRKAVLKILDGKPRPQLRSDGKFLSIQASGGPSKMTPDLAGELFEFKKIFLTATQEIRWAPFWKDPHFFKVLIVESIVWGIAALGIASVFETAFAQEGGPAYFLPLINISVVAGLLVTALAVFFLMLWFKNSSRPHRILLESAIVLAIGVPCSALKITSDLNQQLDLSPPFEETRSIIDAQERRERRGRRRHYGPRTTYHIRIARALVPDSPVPEARWIQVSPAVYDRFRSQQLKEVHLVMGRGWLGVPWFKSVTFLDIGPESR